MLRSRTAVILLAVVLECSSQYQGEGGGYRQDDDYKYQNTPPPPQILTHKQALNHDGNFKYLFTSENGLAQGESIAPDGSRNGGYSYVDPTGRKISVKYTAGKEGFRILEADHLPKAPQPVAPLPVPQQQPHYQPQSYQPQPYQRPGGDDDGQYKPQLYEKPQKLYQQALYGGQAPVPQVRNYPIPVLSHPNQLQARAIPTASNSIEEKEYNDPPGKPYSFGNGYIFDFSG